MQIIHFPVQPNFFHFHSQSLEFTSTRFFNREKLKQPICFLFLSSITLSIYFVYVILIALLLMKKIFRVLCLTRMTTFIKAKLMISDDQTNIDKYRVANHSTSKLICGRIIILKEGVLTFVISLYDS